MARHRLWKARSALRFAVCLLLSGVVVAQGMPHTAHGAQRTARPPTSPINTKALLHDSWDLKFRSPFGAVPEGTKVTLRLRTAHAGATSVSAVFSYKDPRTLVTAPSTTQKLKLVTKGQKYDIWQTTLQPTKIGVYNYAFQIKEGTASLWYGTGLAFNGGVGQAYKTTPTNLYGITSYDPSFKAVSWAPNAIVYQIFPDRFFNGDPSNDTFNRPGPDCGGGYYVHTNENDDPTGSCDFFGGDLQGIIDKLPYLKDLGVNTLYLNPIFYAASNHKYDTADYYRIDPHFGTIDTFNSLIQQAHAMGFHIILDGVFNHTGADSVYFNKYGSFPDQGAYQSQSSPYYPFYTFTSWPTVYNSGLMLVRPERQEP